MEIALRRYLEQHQRAVNSTALEISKALCDDDDTDFLFRRLTRDTRLALHRAIGVAIKAGPVEGWSYGTHGEMCVVVRVPAKGQANFGRIGVSAARLASLGTVPVPNDWPQTFLPAREVTERIIDMVSPSSDGQRIVSSTDGGSIELGERYGRIDFLLTELPDGEVWLRPLEPDGKADLG